MQGSQCKKIEIALMENVENESESCSLRLLWNAHEEEWIQYCYCLQNQKATMPVMLMSILQLRSEMLPIKK